MEQPEATEQHRWLLRLVGDWSIEMEPCAPGEPGLTGTETGRAIGDLWVALEGRAPLPDGSTMATVMTLGYDPASGRFVGTWIGSMMTYLWVYDGEMDPEGRRLVLSAEGPDCCEPGRIGRYRDVVEFLDEDTRTLTSFSLSDAGEWKQFMQTTYRRVH